MALQEWIQASHNLAASVRHTWDSKKVLREQFEPTWHIYTKLKRGELPRINDGSKGVKT